MIALTTLTAGVVLAQAATPVMLQRTFTKGETLNYAFKSLLTAEVKYPGMNTFLPRDYGYEYTFSTVTTAIDEAGYALMRYKRPQMVMIQGEFAEEKEQRTVEKDGAFTLDLRVSPVNALIDIKEAKTTKAMAPSPFVAQGVTDQIAGQFLAQIYRLSLMVGSLDSSLDFAPQFPVRAVKPGDTWKVTVGFSPQKLGNSEKSAVQRLDYLYTYVGDVTENGKKFKRITAKLELDTDLGEFINQQMGLKPDQSGIKGIQTRFTSNLTFNLDPKTLITQSAFARSSGSTQLSVMGMSTPLEEQQFGGESRLVLVSRK